MEKIFNRLGDLFRSFLKTEEEDFTDPDLRDAWVELGEYLKTGQTSRKHSFQSNREKSWTPPPGMSDSLKRDYANLEVPCGAPLEQVKSAYKKLLMHYHPDRFTGHPEKQRLATEITLKLTESFRRIERFHRRRSY